MTLINFKFSPFYTLTLSRFTASASFLKKCVNYITHLNNFVTFPVLPMINFGRSGFMDACLIKGTAMNENKKLLNVLYILLTDELIDINQYIAPSKSIAERVSLKLQPVVRNEVIDKLKNIGLLIRRIIFYEGSLMGFDLNETKIFELVSEMIREVHGEELYASRSYIDAFNDAAQNDDKIAAEKLIRMLQMEKGQEDWSEFELIN